MRAVTQTAPFRHGGVAWGSECAFPSRRGHRMRLCVSARGQSAPFRKVRFSSPGQTWRRLTEKRILLVAPHGKAHSVRRISRKSALCDCISTKKRTLPASRHADCAFPSRRGHRVRLYVSVRGQNAPFRKVRFFSPGQTWRRLTEKRILRVAPHGKAHSAYAPHQKTHFAGERSRALHRHGHATTRLPTHRTPSPTT